MHIWRTKRHRAFTGEINIAQPFVGFNVLAPEFYRSTKPFVDMGPHASVRISESDGSIVGADGWLTSGTGIISYDTFAPDSWSNGDYTVTYSGGGSISINLPNGFTAPNFTITDSVDRVLFYIYGDVSSISVKKNGETGYFTQSFLDRSSKAKCVRFMDGTYTNEALSPDTDGLRTQSEGGLQWTHHGWTWDEIVQLSHEAQCDIWCNVHHLRYNDNTYLTNMANALAECYGRCYIEFSNETWNSGFPVYSWIPTVAGGQNSAGWHADMSDIIAELFKGVSNKFIGVLGSQAVGSGLFNTMVNNATRPLNFIDVVAIAPYWGGTWSFNSSVSTINSTSISDAVATFSSDFDTNWKPFIETWQSNCSSRGWGLVSYEGGSHLFKYLNVNIQEEADAYQKLLDINASQDMANLYNSILDWWNNLTGGGLFCHFADVDYGVWGPKPTENTSTLRWNTLLNRMKS